MPRTMNLVHRTILSVWPQLQLATRHHTHRNLKTGRDEGGQWNYVLPAAVVENLEKDLPVNTSIALDPVSNRPYVLLRVYDTNQYIRNWTAEEDDPRKYVANFIEVETVVEDLLNTFANGRQGGSAGVGPGIILIEDDEPTPAEIAKAIDMQTQYCRWLIEDADVLFAARAFKEITQVHKLGAAWLNEDRPWKREMGQAVPIQCPACKEDIKPEALVCKHCHTDIAKFVKEQGVKVVQAAPAKPSVVPKVAMKPPDLSRFEVVTT